MRGFGFCLAVLGLISWLGVGGAAAGEGTVPAGQKLFSKYHCESCHSMKALKIEKKKSAEEGEEAVPDTTGSKKEPPDLSGVGLKRDAAWIEGWLLKKELIDGKKHKKKFRGTEPETKTLASWLASQKTKVEGAKKPAK
jgi:hypothetical protein